MEEKNLLQTDPEVYKAIRAEIEREKNNLVMIASENYASRAVIEAQANVMTNKYAEGYPGARYYGGCDYVDQVETLAVERAKRLFNADHANVQPHSGSQANMAIYMSFLEPGDLIMGMSLSHGGHLTHGSSVSFSGKIYKSVFYGVDQQTQRIDYDQVRDLAQKHKPKIIVAGSSAYPRIIDFQLFRDIAHENGAYLMADIAHIAGLVAVGKHPSSIGVADFTSTTTHKTLRGPRGGLVLSQGDYAKKIDKSIFPGIQGGPLMHVIAAKAVAFGEALKPEFAVYQDQIIKNAKVLAEELLKSGVDLVSGGTDNHLVLVNLTQKGMTGQDAETALGKAGIVVNKNTIPFDTRGPRVTSGLRLGTPSLTTRGMKEPEMQQIAGFIVEALDNIDSESQLSKIRKSVNELCRNFPIYQYLNEE
ncbi:MAG TPA: serine hydroxymethyltransferase [Desulfobacteraceae bacterium]|nr:serine hydroxymethyltransferase [Desulfobacteraceae bacterium]HPQ28933.1 serine hydroxymethyltransferase [Desulfobacteraceae bacterium]